MGHAAEVISVQDLPARRAAEAPHLQCVSVSAEPLLSRELIIVSGLLILFQLLDGLLTAIGISRLGISAEGNPLLRMLMVEIGALPALVLAKSIALSVILTLFFLAVRVSWVVQAMKVVAAIYLFGAIIPWSGILLLRFS